MATGAAKTPSPLICECGSDHQGTDVRRCPIFGIGNHLHGRIYHLLKVLDFVEFGKNGPMSYCLRSRALRDYEATVDSFQQWQDASERNPEWNLADSISRLRRYFDQVSTICAKDQRTLGSRPSPSVLPVIVDDEEATLKKAKEAVVELYDICSDFILDYGPPDSPHGPDNDPGEYLSSIDILFKEATEAIISIDKAENATIQDLTNKSHRIWRETRRLMCDYHPSLASIFIIPSDRLFMGTGT